MTGEGDGEGKGTRHKDETTGGDAQGVVMPSSCRCTEGGFDTAQKRRRREVSHQTLATAGPNYPYTTRALSARTTAYRGPLASVESCSGCFGADAQKAAGAPSEDWRGGRQGSETGGEEEGDDRA